jgi:hypothetical protein
MVLAVLLKSRAPDLVAIAIGIVVSKILTTYLAEYLVVMTASALGRDVFDQQGGISVFLWLDVLLSFFFELLAFWLAWYVSRSGRFVVPVVVAASVLTLTIVWRWVVKDYGWPGWYEFSLLLTVPVALFVLHWGSDSYDKVGA